MFALNPAGQVDDSALAVLKVLDDGLVGVDLPHASVPLGSARARD